jgi:hypothetical protein
MRYLFNLQHNSNIVITEQCACLNMYAEQATLTSHTMERFEHENAILHRGTCESMERDLELQTAYRCISEAELGLNFTRKQLDLTREEVDTRTHAIIHLKNAFKTQGTELEERVETITNLEQ